MRLTHARCGAALLALAVACSGDKDADPTDTTPADADADTDADADADADADSDADTDTTSTACADADLGAAVPLVHDDTTAGAGADYASGFCDSDASADRQLGFTAPAAARYRFALDADYDSIIALRDGCGAEIGCVDRIGDGGESLVVELDAGAFVVVVVDGHDGAEGSFSLSIAEITDTELVCDDGVDDDADGLVDCADFDCAAEPSCAEVCDDTLDDNDNGLIDCLDPVCAKDANCLPQCPDLTSVAAPDTLTGNTLGALDEITPSCAGGPSSDLSVAFTAPADGEYVFDTVGSTFDTVLSLLDDCGGSEIACNDDWVNTRAQLLAPLVAGETVIVNVDGYDDSSGNFTLNVAPLEEAEVDCDDNRDLDHDGLTDCNDPDCADGPECTEDCADGIDNDGDGDIDCVDPDCSEDVGCVPVCPNEILGAPPETVYATTTGQPDQFTPTCVKSFTSDQSFEFTAPADDTYTFDTFGSNYDTVLYVLDGCGGAELACNDDAGADVQSEVSVALIADQTVIIVVDGWAGSNGDVVLNTQ